MSEPYKTCSCGQSFSKRQWRHLAYAGPLDDGWEVWELRNCPACLSTIAVAMGLSERGHEALREAGVDAEAPTERAPQVRP